MSDDLSQLTLVELAWEYYLNRKAAIQNSPEANRADGDPLSRADAAKAEFARRDTEVVTMQGYIAYAGYHIDQGRAGELVDYDQWKQERKWRHDVVFGPDADESEDA